MAQGVLQPAPRIGGGNHDDAAVAHSLGGAQRAAGLGWVAHNEGGRGFLDAGGEAKRAAESALPHVAEEVAAVAHEPHVAPREAVNRLPVLADEEVGNTDACQ